MGTKGRFGKFVDQRWDEDIVDVLHTYIEIPNVSAMFDADWDQNGHMEKAVQLIAGWIKGRNVAGASLDVLRIDGLSPVILVDIAPAPGAEDVATVLLYGHLDKQPEMTGWRDDLGPWKPVLDGDKLYGRGGADDGYSAFAAITAIEAVQQSGESHGRCVLLIEASEESGSPDLPAYITAYMDRLGDPKLVVCLDSSCAVYEQLWATTSLRGLVGGELTVEVLTEGVHSGSAGGVVPSSMMILRNLLSRVEDPATGEILLDGLHVEIPAERVEQIERAAAQLDADETLGFPMAGETSSLAASLVDALRRRTWAPSLSFTGIDGVPEASRAGNVLRPYTTAKLSFRLPPTVDPVAAGDEIKAVLEASPPFGANVRFEVEETGPGWNAPPLDEATIELFNAAALDAFGVELQSIGEGGSIPFMGMLGEMFPQAQFLITGVLGPGSNAHGPNEFLHIPTAKGVTAAVAGVVSGLASR
jgi:acetylornithine deacetylase/succinyl-diaminopimelate desuccinylase-like protein